MTPDQVASAAAKLNATVFEAMEGTFTTQDFLNTYGADVMQQTVAVAFDELNPRLAELMRAFDGNAEEVAAYAERLIQVQAFLGDAADALGGLFAGLSVDDVLALDTAFGGLGNVMSAAAGYIGSFYTEAERLAMTTEQLRQSFADIGVAMPESNAAFRALVDSLDLTTEGGRDLFRSLMEVAPAFATVTAAAEESAQKLAQTAATLVNDLVSFDLAQASGNSAAQATIRRNALIDQFVRVTPGTEDFAGAYGGNYDAYASAIGGLSKDAFATFGEESRGLLLQIIDSVKGAAAPSGSSSAASAEPPELAKARDWSADIANAEIELLRLQGDELGVLNAQRAIELESLRDAPDALKNLSQSIYDFQKSAIEQAIAERTAQAELARIAERSRERARQSSGFDLDRILKEQADAAESAAASAESMFAASGAGYVERQVKLLDDYLDQVADKTQTATERYADLWSRLSDQLDASKIAEYGDEIVSLSERLSGSSFEFRRDAARVASVAQSRRTQLDPSASAGESERLLKEMLSEIRAGNVAIAQNTAKTAKVLQQFDGEGMPAVRT
jgi:hypothetical protein